MTYPVRRGETCEYLPRYAHLVRISRYGYLSIWMFTCLYWRDGSVSVSDVEQLMSRKQDFSKKEDEGSPLWRLLAAAPSRGGFWIPGTDSCHCL